MINEIFTQGFQDEFNDSSFYAKPKTTQLFVSFNGEQGMLIGNAVVANIEVANEKIPVYSYNSDIFVKFLNGKNVVTGVLALRKTTIDRFITVIEDQAIKLNTGSKVGKINQEKESIKAIIASKKVDSSSLAYYNKKLEDLNQKEIECANSAKALYDRDRLDKSFDLLYYRDVNKELNAKISIVYNDEYVSDITESIEDVLFVKKQTEINIGKSDIIEVYQFIGNPPKNGG